MSKLYLHIGSEKTGSTSIQVFIKENINFFLVNGFGTSESLLNSRLPPLFLFSKSNLVKSAYGLKSLNSGVKAWNSELEFFSKNYKSTIISSEFFQSHLTDLNSIKRLHDYFSNFYDEIVVIYYIRDPWEKAISLLSEAIKAGTGYLNVTSMMNNYFYNSCSLQKSPYKWKKVFSDVRLISMDQALIKDNNLLYSFFDILGIDLPSQDQLNVMRYRLNVSLTVDQASYISCMSGILDKILFIGDQESAKRLQKFLKRIILMKMTAIFDGFYKTGRDKPIKSLFSDQERDYWLNHFALNDSIT